MKNKLLIKIRNIIAIVCIGLVFGLFFLVALPFIIILGLFYWIGTDNLSLWESMSEAWEEVSSGGL